VQIPCNFVFEETEKIGLKMFIYVLLYQGSVSLIWTIWTMQTHGDIQSNKHQWSIMQNMVMTCKLG